MKRLVIFDFDGVLADSLRSCDQTYRRVFAHFGRPVPYSDFREWYDSHWEQNWLRGGFAPEDLPAGIAAYWRFVDYSNVLPFDGLPAQLSAVSRLAPLVICSTTEKGLIAHFLEQTQLRNYFQEIYSESSGSSKEALFRRAITELGVMPADTIVIGDTPADIAPARALGCLTIGATYGWCPAEKIYAAQPAAAIDRPDQIAAAVMRLFGDAR